MFNIDFYNFAKDENSTKRPSGSPDTYSCQMKRPGGLVSPTIELNIGLTTAPAWNYCYIANFNRYYFIEEWTFESGFWTASLSCDTLATYRTEIGDSYLYALRSANLWDGRIVDGFYPAKTGCTFQREAITSPWKSTTDGTFVIGAVSKDAEYGALNYYIMNIAAFKKLVTGLNDDAIIGSWNAVEKSVLDPFQYIKSCIYLPISLADLQGSAATLVPALQIWNWTVPLTPAAPNLEIALKLNISTPYRNFTDSIAIPKHPQASARGTFLNQAPFTIYTLSYPPFGIIDIDTTTVNNVTNLDIEARLDLATGLGILTVSAGSYVLNRIEAKIGVEVVLSQVTRDYVGGASAILGGITAIAAAVATIAFPPAGIAMGAVAAGAAISAAPQVGNAIGNGISALTPRAQTIGSGGSYAQLYTQFGLYAQFFEIVDDDLTKNGRPCCQVIQPKNVGGYLLIQDGDITMGGTHQEAAIVKSYLESGFYWE